MNLAATFYISVYGLAALAGAILAWAEQTPSVTVATVPIALAALLLNERSRKLRLDGIWIGVAGIAAFAYPAHEMFSGNEESRLLAVAHLLVIMQWVLMCSRKYAHQYWWICALSCVQIAVAAVLTNSPLFGLLILIYMFWAMWTLSVFTLLLARLRYGRDDLESTTDWVWPELHDSTSQLTLGQIAAGMASYLTGMNLPRLYAKLAAVPPTAADSSRQAPNLPVRSEFRSSVQGNAHEADLNWRFVLGMLGMSASAMSLGLVFFLLTPRLWIGTNPFQDTALAGINTQSGFSERVQLGDFGRILESSAPVLELEIRDEQTDKPVDLRDYLRQIGQSEPLLRGTVLAVYQGGSWGPHRATPGRTFNKRLSMFQNRNRRFFRQTIRLEPIDTRSLFSLVDPDFGRVEDQAGEILIIEESRALRLLSMQSTLRGAVLYHLVTAERTGGADRSLYQAAPDFTNISSTYLTRLKNCDFLDALADSLLERTRARTAPQDPTPSQIAEVIVSHLRDSGEYGYSLDQSVQDANIDPVEDFLKNRKTGHCQYFATALALLLRAADIPSRVVTGFKGGIERPAQGIVAVQQRHAHAWVEAHLDGQWVTLDATPADERNESVAAVGDSVRWYHKMLSMGSTVWNDYFLNLSYSKQQRDLYEPLQSFAGLVTERLAGKSSFWSVLQATLREFWLRPQTLFSVRGGLTAFLLMLTLVGMFYFTRFLWRLLLRISRATAGRQRNQIYIEFYERFLALLKPRGLVPQASQTQLEFARQIETEWDSHGLPRELVSLAEEISMAFYHLRFGTDPLSAEREERIQSRLRQLETVEFK